MKRAEFERAFVIDEMAFDPAERFPPGDHVYFECKLCGEIVGAGGAEFEECACGNLVMDYDAGRLRPHYADGTVLVFRARPRPV